MVKADINAIFCVFFYELPDALEKILRCQTDNAIGL